MSDLIIKKNGTDYKLPMLAEHYPADRVYLDGDISKTVQDLMPIDVSDLVTLNQSSGVYISAKKNKNGTVTINVSANGAFSNGSIILSLDSSIAIPSSLYGKLLGMGTVINTQDSYLSCIGLVANGSIVIYFSANDTAKVVQYSITYPIA